MPFPIALAAAARMGGGAALRGAAVRAGASETAVNSAGGRLASQATANYGVNAIQRHHQNRQDAYQQRVAQQQRRANQDQGFSGWIKDNPNEATLAATGYAVRTLTSSSTLAQNATANTHGLLQSTQFR